ncbi:FhaA domain-containing protein [Capillimicrobium parvum]|uniref:FHA domain-containing protein n=1 Tax=Capillimicrobium parvum TaxID=2884022 RepID=A0A9E6XRH7_9ACTN|nr:DUF3662 and FHA domain-containing protein [Capillimicrobium parvum]UGS33647.1 hypothetical protein DSM104329_00012 [Capillimicrobium parvum]
MSVLRNLENRIAGLVEGTFGRVFKSEVRPVEIAHKLAKEMDEHRTVSVSRTYVPNEYTVWLSPDDRERYEGVEHEVIDELSGYLLEHARRERLALISRPKIEFRTDDRLSLGEFGIQARLVRAADGAQAPAAAPAVEPAGHGNTMIYSAADRHQEQLSEVRANRAGRAIIVVDGKRMLVGATGAVLGRSRECDIVVDDANVSRRHAEVRPSPNGWTVADLGSTNGVRVNGRPVRSAPQPLRDGDLVELGTAQVTFEID